MLMSRKMLVRMTSKPSKEKPEYPELKHSNIEISIQTIENVDYYVCECPCCGSVFGVPLKNLTEMINQYKRGKNHKRSRDMGVV